MKKTTKMLIAAALVFTLAGISIPPAQCDNPTITTVFMFIYGYGSLDVGDEITVYTSDGVLCGRADVSDPGQYGLMAVYGNDPFSRAKDGAETDEVLRIEVNGDEVIFPVGKEPRFGGDGETMRVDLD